MLDDQKTRLLLNESGFFFAGDGWVCDVRQAIVMTQNEAEHAMQKLQVSDSQIGLRIGYRVTSCAAVLQDLVQAQGSYVVGLPQRHGHPMLLTEDGEWLAIRNLDLDLLGVARFLCAAAAEGATLDFDDSTSMKVYRILGPVGSSCLVEI